MGGRNCKTAKAMVYVMGLNGTCMDSVDAFQSRSSSRLKSSALFARV